MKSENRDAKLIFGEALRLSVAAERAAYLDQACAEDLMLRQEVESLLRAYANAGDFLNQTRPLPASDLLIEHAGTRIGRYKLLEQIGEGGFGVVWMADQEEPVRRRVALKIIKLGMDTKEVVARFEAERQALAMMDHPNIARVFDGGATETGRPYFVMELVKGIPITEYCDANKLSAHERLPLFVQVCQAVQHAHQKGVIHRDLKPSNVLVTVQDDRPVPKVIDFGVAKATQGRLTEKTVFTRFHQFIGTPAYMSPEQAGLGSLDVDTRSDIYSLGVLLYELLTGRTPFDTQKLLAAGYDAVMRTIREEEPPKPSARLSELKAEELKQVATRRHADSANLERAVRGDLDWIAMKALEKDRTRRYETAAALAQDVARHLDQEPILARPPGAGYLAGKFIRRHRVALGTLALIAVALAAGGALSLRLAFVARAERDNARAAQASEARQRLAAQQSADESHTRLVQIDVANGARALDNQDWFGALLWFAEALRQDAPGSRAERMHRLRIGALLNYCPRLCQLWTHAGSVNSAAFSPDGLWALTASADGTARLWNAKTGQAGPVLAHGSNVTSAVFNSDGRRILTLGDNGTARVWDTLSGQPAGPPLHHEYRVHGALVSPDGLRVYTVGDPTEPNLGAVVLPRNSPEGEIRIWDAASGRATRPPIRHRGQISGLALSPDGTWLAAALGTSTLAWNLREYRALQLPRGTNSQVVLLPGTPATQPGAELEARLPVIPSAGKGAREGASPVCLAFSPDSGRLLVGYDDLSGAVWSLPDGKRLQLQLSKRPPQLPRSSYPESVAFSADGHRAFLADSDGVVRVWDAQTGESDGQLEKRGDRRLRLGPDGRLAFLSGQVWDLHAGKPLSPAPLHWSWRDAAFSPDGARVLTAGTDGTVRLWDLAGGTPAIPPLKHDWSAVQTNQYHPDSPRALTMREEFDRALLSSLPGSVRGWFSPDGSRILSVSENGSARVWEARTGEPITPFMFIGKPCANATFSPDARRIATTGGYSNDGVARVWDGVTGAPITPVINYPDELKSAVLTPNQEWLVTTTEEGTQLWDARDGRETAPAFTHGTQPRCLAFSQDGRFLAMCAKSGKSTNSPAADTKPSFSTTNGNWETRIYDARTYAPMTPRLTETNPVVEMEFSPDGCWLVTLTVDANAQGPRGPNSMKVARLWDTRTGEPVSEPIPTLYGPIVAFAREKSLVIILRFSGNPVVLDLPKRRALNLTQWRGLNLHPSAITSDGERIAKATGPQVSVYDAVTAEPITPPLETRTQPAFTNVRFSPDGTSLLVAAGDRVQLFPLPVERRSAETVGALAKLLAGREIDSSGFYARLSFAEAVSLWQTFRPQYPEDFGTSLTQRRYWHEDVLDLAEAQNRWFCALLHLGQLLLEFPNDTELSLRRAHASDQAALEQLK